MRSALRYRFARRPFLFSCLATLAAPPLLLACVGDFDTTRSPPPRGTVGTELYGVLCDRVGAQALHEDLTGASYRSICHEDASGNWGTQVDQSLLPAFNPDAVDGNGNPVSVATQQTDRTYNVGRVEAMGRGRANLIASLDATFPAIQVPIKDTTNANPTATCNPSPLGTDSLKNQLADLLARFTALYDDGTIPQSTESLARIFNAIQSAPDAQTSFARFAAREGYRPIDLTLGAARPAIAYSGLRDLSNDLVALLSADSQPYDTSKVDAQGNRIPIPGPANAQLNALIAASHDELLYATADAPLAALVTSTDPTTGRTVLSRPRGDLETLQDLFYARNANFGNPSASPSFITFRDPRGYAQVHKINGAIPAPFVDANNDGLADVDALGQFVTTNGQVPPSPFFAVGDTYGTRDTCGRALRAGLGATTGSTSDAGTGVDGGLFRKLVAPPHTLAAGTDGGSAEAGAGDAGSLDASTPIAAVDAGAASATCGVASDDDLVYDYLDTSHVFATTLMSDLKPLVNPDPTAKHNTVMFMAAGLPVVMGTRDGSAITQKCYSPSPTNAASCQDPSSELAYNAFETKASPMLDLVYAGGQMLGDPTIDDTLSYVSTLFTSQTPTIARLTGDALAMKANANAHTEAVIPPKSTFWDEMLDVTVQMEQEPGLLEDVLTALGSTSTGQLGTIFANYMQFNDKMSYDPGPPDPSSAIIKGLNGPVFNVTTGAAGDMQTPVDRTKPDTGFNRSAMQRFLQTVHDTDGVAACNRDQAVVHAQGIPLLGSADVCAGGLCNGVLGVDAKSPFPMCGVFKIDNLATFYLDSIVGKANLYFRSSFLTSGIAGIGAATVALIEQSSGLGYDANNAEAANNFDGFWDATTAKTFRPRPQWLNRLVFFDQTTNTASTDTYYTTQHFLADLNGYFNQQPTSGSTDPAWMFQGIGTSVCPEEVIPDPCANGIDSDCSGATDIGSDKMVHGLRNCADGDWLQQRDADTIFTWEDFGFYQAITPLLTAFVNHGREDLFIGLMEVLDRHWQDGQGTADECLLSSDPTAQYKQCSKDGVVTYEPLLIQDFQGDIFAALQALEPILASQTIPSCTATNASGACTAESNKNGITVLAAATRGLVDPKQAAAISLVDRSGSALGLRNDGTTNPQVTPIYLLTEALNTIDATFAALPSTPNDDRLSQWRLARSQLVDEFLTVNGTGATSTFQNTAIPAFIPVLIDALRAQLWAHCPTTFVAPNALCTWARSSLTTEMTNVVHGPVFAAAMDILEATRTDAPTRAAIGNLLQYLLDAASSNEALPSTLASANDLLQLLEDDTNLVPLYHALSTGFEPTTTDAAGHILQKSVIDAQLSLLGRVSGRAMDANGNEICSQEIDPNQVLVLALANAVTPMTNPDGSMGQAPLQAIMDVIGDVNRADPNVIGGQFAATDYANIADNVSSFLLDKTRGMEQFYQIVRNGTEGQ